MGKILFIGQGRSYAVYAKVCRLCLVWWRGILCFSGLFLLLAPAHSHACTSVNVSANNLYVGAYNSLSSSANWVRVDVRLECQTDGFEPTVLLPFEVGLSSMNSGSANVKEMQWLSYRLRYGIYTRRDLASPWGATGSAQTVAGLFPVALVPDNQVISGYVNVPAKQNIPSGSYSDFITFTVEF